MDDRGQNLLASVPKKDADLDWPRREKTEMVDATLIFTLGFLAGIALSAATFSPSSRGG